MDDDDAAAHVHATPYDFLMIFFTGADARPAQENGRELGETQNAHLGTFFHYQLLGDANSYWDEAFLPPRTGALLIGCNKLTNKFR